MKYDIPKEVRSPVKLLFSLYAKDLLIVGVGTLVLLNITSEFVHSWFTIPYFIVGFGFLIFLVCNSAHNPGKKNYHTLFFLIKSNKTVYHPIDRHKVENEIKYSDHEVEVRENA
ncbi:DUF5592 family protein [Bacillus subtilis]|uniref:DUF5592 family protein n=1 Tax=Bacillus subtilis TaxID=1423 RepID=UPI0015E78D3F|nr:DUF5592 family protein [Bacillus subtilis]